jgi:branched-subunit amino acid transport protein
MPNVYLYILCMALVTFLIRVLPLTLIRRQIKNRVLRSFLYYVPYVTLAVMTFPAILSATQSVYSALAALVVAIVLAWRGKGLFPVSVLSCLTVLVAELLI